MKPNRMQHFVRVIISAVSLLVLASCGQQAPAGANPPGSSPLTAQAAVSGLTGTYYDLSNFTGLTLTRVDTTIDFAWGTGAPLAGIQPTTYGVAWAGQIQAPTTEEYTFFVTSGGGARLMVNGIGITKNWTDHAVTTDTGKINLVTGQKVDIRLEYYRNTTNPGTVKLEWQSATKARAVVPAGSLFSTGSNTQSALDVVKANTKIVQLGVTFDPAKAAGVLAVNNTITLMAYETNGNFVTAVTGAGTISQLIRFSKTGTTGVLTDLIDGSVLNLGDLSAYFSANGTQTQAQAESFTKKVVPFLSKGMLKEKTISATSKSSNLTAKGIVIDLSCSLFFPPPPACDSNGDVCGLAAQNVQGAACLQASLVEDGISFLLGGAFGVAQIIETFAVHAKDILQGNFDSAAATKAYLECLARNKDKCPIKMTVETPLVKTVPVNTSGPISFKISNLPNPDSIGLLDARFSLQLGSGTSAQELYLLAPFIELYPGSSGNIGLQYSCPATPKILSGTVTVTSNATVNPIQTVSVTITCQGFKYGPTSLVSSSISFENLSYGVNTATVTGTSTLSGNPNSYRGGILGLISEIRYTCTGAGAAAIARAAAYQCRNDRIYQQKVDSIPLVKQLVVTQGLLLPHDSLENVRVENNSVLGEIWFR